MTTGYGTPGMEIEDGRVPSEPGSHPSGHAASGVDGASRFDPSRGDKPARVLVCGGRTYSNYQFVFEILDKLSPTTIIAGGAKGADKIAADWARSNANLETYEADWNRHGKAAGPIRNQQMIDEGKPDLVLAFSGGRGTADMLRRAHAAGLWTLDLRDSDTHPTGGDAVAAPFMGSAGRDSGIAQTSEVNND